FTHPVRRRAARPATASRPPNWRPFTGLWAEKERQFARRGNWRSFTALSAEKERRFGLGHGRTVVLLPSIGGLGALGAGGLAEELGQFGGVGVAQRQAGDHADGPDGRRVRLGQTAAQ